MPVIAQHTVPTTLSRSSLAAPQRTLVDILEETAQAHPDALAIDDGATPLTYRELLNRVATGAAALREAGVRRGDRVGIRIPSGTHELYVGILAILAAGAAYVPVDADDPEERAQLVFGEAAVAGILGPNGLTAANLGPAENGGPGDGPVDVEDDAWIIFTSGSTGVPKGVAVSHRSAAAFVDAEARLFLTDEPLGPQDRVLAGLSVAFDASCEEMWLAWRSGACLVPAPRALVRSGVDLGPWLVSRHITVISTVPTLASLWPSEALDSVRLLIFGGEACPPELATRLAAPGRELWNTYGPTEATVVACAAQLLPDEQVRIGLPLDGWDLAVVDSEGRPVAPGQTGELVIGGVGLARYLDPAKDAEKYAPMPTLGWQRAYRSGDVVVNDPEGLLFVGRVDDQVKIGGRRIELGEIDAALAALPGVTAAATTVRKTGAGVRILVGYLAGTKLDVNKARAALAASLPAPMIPRLVLLPELPTRTSGKVDRNALPWPLPSDTSGSAGFTGTAAWVAAEWTNVLGVEPTGLDDDFFADGGGSLSAAQLVSALRQQFPHVTVAEIYDHPRLGALADHLDAASAAQRPVAPHRDVAPMPRLGQAAQVLTLVLLNSLTAAQWLVWLAIANNVLAWAGTPWARPLSWWWVALAFLVFITPFGRMGIAVGATRLLLRDVRAGTYQRGGSMHLRLWAAERLTEMSGATNLSGAPWMVYYARALGSKIGHRVDLHALPPVTGMLTVEDGAAIEPETDLSGFWIDGDKVHVGPIFVGEEATIGARSILLPGAVVGKRAEVAAGSAVTGTIGAGQPWAGSPAARSPRTEVTWPSEAPPRNPQWLIVYAATAVALATLPLISLVAGAALLGWAIHTSPDLGSAAARSVAVLPGAALVSFATLAGLTVLAVRLLSLGLKPGFHPVRGRVGWQAWTTERLSDAARTYLFPLYASLLSPLWLRLLGAKVGSNTEISTVLLIPKFTTIGDGAFLADDTMVASYELGGGWMRLGEAKIGKRAFLGNSGIAGPGRRVPKNGLVAVLSAAPDKAKRGQSWLGSPPVRLRRNASTGDTSRTFQPPARLKALRGLVELCRMAAVFTTFGIGLLLLGSLQYVINNHGYGTAALLSGPLLFTVGLVAALVAAAAKWVTVGRIRSQDGSAISKPLWSGFVWRNEVSDAFVEVVAAPWFARAATGTVLLNWWLRALGAKIGPGVWCESYWLPEADLVTLGAGSTVNRGCVVQTHLFHDRIMSVDTVVLEEGATLGPHSVALPASRIGAGATIGPASLVMRGDVVPPSSQWQGNPIAPWHDSNPVH